MMPADPNGQLAYITKKATAPAGALEIDSKNASSTPHDIAIEGNGVKEDGKTVSGGGVSTITVDAQARRRTRTSARCRATATAAWKARSPSSSAAPARAASRRR